MKRFTRLCMDLAATTSATRKVDLLVAYFRAVPEEDAAAALACLLGQRGRRPIASTTLRSWACERAAIPLWLFEQCYESVGDLGETLALVLPDSAAPTRATDDVSDGEPLHRFLATRVDRLASASPEEAKRIVFEAWDELDVDGRFLFHKLIGGAFRMGVARGLILRAIAEVAELDLATATHRLTGRFSGTAAAWRALVARDESDALPTRPYPFCLASPLEGAPEDLGSIEEHLLEWKFDGIRCQLLRRGTSVAVVSRGEERIDGSFPELVALARTLPDGTALDGEVLVVARSSASGATERIQPFQRLQTFLQAKRPAWVAEPGLFDGVADGDRVIFIAYDLLEFHGADQRAEPLRTRRARLETLIESARLAVAGDRLRLSPSVVARDWTHAASLRGESRARGVEGLMIKRLDQSYGVGRERRAGWWKWKVDPYAIDAVLVAAQPGTGRRANLLTDYTFAVWRHPPGPGAADAPPRAKQELVTLAKAYSGLTDDEILTVDRHARATTTAKRGPVRLLEPTLVFELGFEGLERSARHKAGIALRFPRMLRWRRDKRPEDADCLATVESLLRAHTQ